MQITLFVARVTLFAVLTSMLIACTSMQVNAERRMRGESNLLVCQKYVGGSMFVYQANAASTVARERNLSPAFCLELILSAQSDMDICEVSLYGELPQSDRGALNDHIRRRGLDCSKLAGAIATERASAAQQEADLYNSLRQSTYNTPEPLGGTYRAEPPGDRYRGRFVRSYQSGQNRVCVYDYLGSANVITIRALDVCPF